MTCKWYEAGEDFFKDRCLNPMLPLNLRANAQRLMIRGEMATLWTSCQTARGYENECAAEAKLWEAKETT